MPIIFYKNKIIQIRKNYQLVKLDDDITQFFKWTANTAHEVLKLNFSYSENMGITTWGNIIIFTFVEWAIIILAILG